MRHRGEHRGTRELIADVVGFKGASVMRPTSPIGAPRKLLDVSRLNAMGWRPRIPLREGLADAYRWYVECAGIPR